MTAPTPHPTTRLSATQSAAIFTGQSSTITALSTEFDSTDLIDGVPTDAIPSRFMAIATKIELFHLRRKLNKQDSQNTDGESSTEDDSQKSINISGRFKRENLDPSTVCPNQSCIDLLKQYEQWRHEHGYAYYTGVWKVGK